jgi:hypothetical protein
MGTTVMKPIPRVPANKYRGLGDVVHAVAQPIAKGIDLLVGTHLDECPSCGKRRDDWNRKFPL